MKKTLLFLASMIFTLGFSQWAQCDKVSYTTVVDSISPGLYKLSITVKNNDPTEFPNDNNNLGYCHYGLLETEGEITFSGDDQCVSPIAPFGTRVLEYEIGVKDTLVDSVCVNLKMKNTLDQTLYCDQTFCFAVEGYWPLSVDEIDLTGVSFKETYFDLMGRQVISPRDNSLYIVKKSYENGYEVVEKIFYSDME